MKPLLLAHTPDATRLLSLGRRSSDVEARLVPTLPDPATLDPDRPVVVLLDRALLARTPDVRERLHALALVGALVWCASPGEQAPGPDVPADLLVGWLPAGAPVALAAAIVRGAMRHALTQRAERIARREAEERLAELTQLAHVGAALGTERDLTTLLRLVLHHALRLSGSDAGSLYLVERPADAGDHGGAAEGEARVLRFMLTHNHTLPSLALDEFTIPVDRRSVAGYAAATDSVLAIADVRDLRGAEYVVDGSFDARSGYHTRSMLVTPLRTQRGDVVGVLQLINRKRHPDAPLLDRASVEREVIPFDAHCVELVGALAAQAGVAIENSRLHERIERLFEGFVTASVTAIESRDPATSGHSARVARLTTGLAEALEHERRGTWRGLRFTREQLRELRYAALLHDFGKVGVREEVLVKARKLYPIQLERIRHRVHALVQDEELRFERARAEHALAHGRRRGERLERLAVERDARRAQLERLLYAVERANEPSVLAADAAHALSLLAGAQASGGAPVLHPDELASLCVTRGTLDAAERREMEAHVSHTHRFLAQIPWTPELCRVADFAHGHHEKLNGRGYPRGLTADRIPVQVRMMTIADIYDALTAADRPYKRAVRPERALEILRLEADAGELDRDLLDTFVEARVFRVTEEGGG